MKHNDYLEQKLKCLPKKDYDICMKLVENHDFDNIKEIVDSDIKKLEKEQDKTENINENLEKLYKLSECLDAYIINFKDQKDDEYEEI